MKICLICGKKFLKTLPKCPACGGEGRVEIDDKLFGKNIYGFDDKVDNKKENIPLIKDNKKLDKNEKKGKSEDIFQSTLKLFEEEDRKDDFFDSEYIDVKKDKKKVKKERVILTDFDENISLPKLKKRDETLTSEDLKKRAKLLKDSKKNSDELNNKQLNESKKEENIKKEEDKSINNIITIKAENKELKTDKIEKIDKVQKTENFNNNILKDKNKDKKSGKDSDIFKFHKEQPENIEKKVEEKSFKMSFSKKDEVIKDEIIGSNKKDQPKKEENIKNDLFKVDKNVDKGFKISTAEKNRENRYLSQSPNYYKLPGFFKRTFFTLIDQSLIFLATYIFFIISIIPNMLENRFKSFEAIAFFINNDRGNFIKLVLFFISFNIIYYLLSALFLNSTPTAKIFGYSLYNYKGEKVSKILLILRVILGIGLNLIVFIPYLFIFVSDFKQSIYDKIFKVYLLKKTE